jgi:hypothetical protein
MFFRFSRRIARIAIVRAKLRPGDQNWDEMQGAFLGLVFDTNTDVTKVFKPSGPSMLPRGKSGPVHGDPVRNQKR